MKRVLTTLLISSALPAYAANFEVSKGDFMGVAITGEIDPDEFEHFKVVAEPVAALGDVVLVDLESPGGNLFAALQIELYGISPHIAVLWAQRWNATQCIEA